MTARSVRKARARRRVLPGYPVPPRELTDDEIRQYLHAPGRFVAAVRRLRPRADWRIGAKLGVDAMCVNQTRREHKSTSPPRSGIVTEQWPTRPSPTS